MLTRTLRCTPPFPSISVPAFRVTNCARQSIADASRPANKYSFTVGSLIPVPLRLGAPGQRLDHRSAAYADAGIEQSVQKIVEHRVHHLLGDRSLIGKPE